MIQNTALATRVEVSKETLCMPVVRVGAYQHRAVLGVEREMSDVNVARCLEDSSGFPVQSPVRVQQNANTIKVRHQLLRSATHTATLILVPTSHQ